MNKLRPSVGLTAFYVTLMITSLVLTSRIILIHNVVFSGCLFTFPLIYILSDVITEIYGYKIANSLLWTALFCALTFSLITNLVVMLPTTATASSAYANAFATVFSQDIKFVCAGMVAIAIGGWANTFCITKMRSITRGKYLILRTLTASSIGEFINSFIAFPLAFWGTINMNEVLSLAFTAFVIKILYNIITVYPATIYMGYLKTKGEQNNFYNFQISYN